MDFGISSDSTSRVDNTNRTVNTQGLDRSTVFGDISLRSRSNLAVTMTDHGALATAASNQLAASELARRSIDASASLAERSSDALITVVSRSLDAIESERGRSATLLAADRSSTAALLTAERATPEGDAFAESAKSITQILTYLLIALGVVGVAFALRRA